MSDITLSTLITFASGAIGAASGFFAAVISSKISAKAQMQQTIATEAFRARSETYEKVLSSETMVQAASDLETQIEAVAAFRNAVAAAKIVSSAETTACLIAFQTQVEEHLKDKKKSIDYNGITIAMQHDLNTFTVPEVRRNIWTKWPRCEQRAKRKTNRKACKSQKQ